MKKQEPTILEKTGSFRLNQLYEEMKQACPHLLIELENEGSGWVDLAVWTFTSDEAEKRTVRSRQRARVTMSYNESGIPLVSVTDLFDGKHEHIYVSDNARAVVAVILR